MEKSIDAIERIRAEAPVAKVIAALLDLSSMDSIRSFAKFYEVSFPGQSLDVLVNNAGIMNLAERQLTVDGFERQFATNYMGPFVLTSLLYPHLKQQPGTRIVTLGSKVVHFAKIDFDNLQSEKKYTALYGTYAQSKLANLIFMLEFQRRLSASSSPVISVGAHPGVAVTNLMSNMGGLLTRIGIALAPLIGQDAAHGALPSLFAATSPDVVAGGYYGPNKLSEQKGFPVPAKIPAWALDTAVAHRLWAKTEQLTGVMFDLNAYPGK